LVEDDPAVRRSLQLLLRGRGFDVRAYASGLDLLADPTSLLARGLIADFRMPDADGLMVLQTLRARGWTGSALLITGFPIRGLTERAVAVGFDRVIQKPLIDGAFADAVERLVGAEP
jgi:FixJ family two-component response regulator